MVANAVLRRLFVVDMVGGAAIQTNTATRYTLGDLLVGDLNVDHAVDLDTHTVKCLGLRNGAGKAVQNETVFAVVLCQTVLDDTDDHLVRNQLACLDIFLGCLSHFRAALQRFTDNITRGNGGDHELFADDLRLCTFSGARGAEKNQLHKLSSFSSVRTE